MNPSPETSRRLLLAAVLAALSGGHAALAAGSGKKRGSRRTPANNQARDIDALVHELDYLIEVARNLHHKHGGDTSRIRFNYPALLAQLTAARPAVIKSRPLVSP